MHCLLNIDLAKIKITNIYQLYGYTSVQLTFVCELKHGHTSRQISFDKYFSVTLENFILYFDNILFE